MSRRPSYNQADVYAQRARAQGAPARSVFKLEEIDQRWRLLARGQRVLELGAAPGSWTQYIARRVGPSGRVVAIDLSPLRVRLPDQVQFVQGDAFNHDFAAQLAAWTAEGPERALADVVLSDMAPNTTGDHRTDAWRAQALAERALDVAHRFAARGSHLVVKVLEGPELPALAASLKGSYAKLERLRPKATRQQSSEMFLVALKKTAGPT